MNSLLPYVFTFAQTPIKSVAAALFLLAAAGIASPTFAQSNDSVITPEKVVRYLSQDLFLSPGVGFKRVQVGHPFVQVKRVWGKPNRGFESSEVGNKVIWVYLANDSSISLTGGSRVKAIRVEGSFTSPFSSSEGAQFGMTPQQVISIYGPPKEKDNLVHLSYPSKGIEFKFEHGGLKWMRVFSPK